MVRLAPLSVPVLPDGGQPLVADAGLFEAHRGDRSAETCVGGVDVLVRPVLPTDVGAIADLVAGLSERSAYHRFHTPLRALSSAQLAGLVDIDHRERETLLALVPRRKGRLRLVGIGQYVATGPTTVEAALLVADDWQRRGIGRALAERVIAAARDAGYDAAQASVLAENRAALALARSLGLGTASSAGPVLELTYRFAEPPAHLPGAGELGAARGRVPVAG